MIHLGNSIINKVDLSYSICIFSLYKNLAPAMQVPHVSLVFRWRVSFSAVVLRGVVELQWTPNQKI